MSFSPASLLLAPPTLTIQISVRMWSSLSKTQIRLCRCVTPLPKTLLGLPHIENKNPNFMFSHRKPCMSRFLPPWTAPSHAILLPHLEAPGLLSRRAFARSRWLCCLISPNWVLPNIQFKYHLSKGDVSLAAPCRGTTVPTL